jgi:hypothetical protein
VEEVFGSVAAVALHVKLEKRGWRSEGGEARVEKRGWRSEGGVQVDGGVGLVAKA